MSTRTRVWGRIAPPASCVAWTRRPSNARCSPRGRPLDDERADRAAVPKNTDGVRGEGRRSLSTKEGSEMAARITLANHRSRGAGERTVREGVTMFANLVVCWSFPATALT